MPNLFLVYSAANVLPIYMQQAMSFPVLCTPNDVYMTMFNCGCITSYVQVMVTIIILSGKLTNHIIIIII